MILFEYPKQANCQKIIPKETIYKHLEANSSLKNLFIRHIDKITWKYKLSAETININATDSVNEVQILEVILKEQDFKLEILQAIDEAIPSAIIFELIFADNIKIVACHKKPSQNAGSKPTLSEYFCSNWLQNNQPKKSLPIVLNLEELYKQLLLPLLPYQAKDNENLTSQIARIGQIIAKEKIITKLEKKLANEKQFNRKVEINSEIRIIKKEIEKLL